ncbi:hypothetical protein [Aggregatibacter kilianii]|uniref:hypothetical protein n=1 Tax=Aggregatibacter kilianii TaxID=2025884 RepID=UPI000D65AE3D|nr:hypothetical protein [Aggregatibacter kilianii]
MMKKVLSAVIFSGVLSACAHTQNEPIGGQKDAHGCLIAAGQSYSFLKQQCVQVFDIADIKFNDPTNDMLAVLGILSEDKQQVEIFAAGLPENTILQAVKGGYASKDRKVRLIKTKKSWKIRR